MTVVRDISKRATQYGDWYCFSVGEMRCLPKMEKTEIKTHAASHSL
jgi:hypothetical protein